MSRDDTPPGHAGEPPEYALRDGPTKGAVVLFITAVITTVILVAAGTGFAVWSSQRQVSSTNRQWCTTLSLLTRTPVPKPEDPKANPSREATYELYTDFLNLKKQFRCA